MANFYVRKTGSDSNNGTSPATAWATIGKALGSSGISSGDTVYIGAGVYREVVTVNMTSATSETKIIGDIDGSKTGDVGEIRWTAYLTHDKFVSGTSSIIDFNSRDYLSFEKITFVACKSSVAQTTNGTISTNIKFIECYFISGVASTQLLSISNAPADSSFSWLIDKCLFCQGLNTSIFLITTVAGTGNWNLDINITNSLFLGGNVQINLNNINTGFAGGLIVKNCSFIGGSAALQALATGATQSFPHIMQNSFLFGQSSIGIVGGNTGQIIEDYNYFACSTPRSNVNAGPNSVATGSYSYHFHLGQEIWQGKQLKPAFTPCLDSPLLGFGNTTGAPVFDFMNRKRPSGPGLNMNSTGGAVGYIEYHDFGRKENSVIDGVPNPLKLIGPGDQQFLFAVQSGRTTNISVNCRYDLLHGTGSKPHIALVENGELGITGVTGNMSANTNTWELVSLPTFIPSGDGYTNVRFVSNSTGASGISYFAAVDIF